jgi:hypothetical protein
MGLTPGHGSSHEQPIKRLFGAAEQLAEKVGEDAKSLPQALKRLQIFNGLAARLKSGPTQNLPQS